MDDFVIILFEFELIFYIALHMSFRDLMYYYKEHMHFFKCLEFHRF